MDAGPAAPPAAGRPGAEPLTVTGNRVTITCVPLHMVGRGVGRGPGRGGVAVAVTVLGMAALAVAVRPDPGLAAAPSAVPGPLVRAWERLPDPPVRPRSFSVAAAVDGEAVFLGGLVEPPCPSNASCDAPAVQVLDGAAFAPAIRTWRRTAPAPAALDASYTEAPVVGGSVWALSDAGLLAYDVRRDRWTSHPLPPDQASADPQVAYRRLTADGDRLVLAGGEHRSAADRDRVFDPATGTWSTLPPDPLTPSFDRTLTSTPAGLVLTAKAWSESPGSERPSVLRAALLAPGAGSWRLLPDSDQLGGGRWAWTGRRMVDPSLGGADGGEVGNYGRTVPNGGVLDPVAGRWSRLPSPPPELGGGWTVEALAGPVVAAGGWLYDDAGQSWTRLPRPSGAPHQPGPAVWVDGTLVVLVGRDLNTAAPEADPYSGHAWAYRL